jgi:hypothetical protein
VLGGAERFGPLDGPVIDQISWGEDVNDIGSSMPGSVDSRRTESWVLIFSLSCIEIVVL